MVGTPLSNLRYLSFNGAPVGNLWRDNLQGRNIAGTVTVDEEGRIAESNEGNNSRMTQLLVTRHSPSSVQVSRTGAGLQLQWQPTLTPLRDGSHISVRYTLRPTGPVRRIFTVVGSGTNTIFLPPDLPWSEMVDNRACFRVVGYKNSDSPAYELVSAPSNEVCFAVRDRRNWPLSRTTSGAHERLQRSMDREKA